MTIPNKNINSTTPVKSSQDNLSTSDEKASVFKWFGRKIKTYSAKAYMFFHCLIFYRSRPKNLDEAKIDKMWGVTKKIFNIAYSYRIERIEDDSLKKLSGAFNGQIKLEYDGKGGSVENIRIVEIEKITRPIYLNSEQTCDKWKLVDYIFDDSMSDALFEKFLSLTNELIEHKKLDKQEFIREFIQKDNTNGIGHAMIVTAFMEDDKGCRENKLKSLFNFIKDLDVPNTNKIDAIIGDDSLAYFFMDRRSGGFAKNMAAQADYFVSLVNEIFYPTIESESDKKYFAEKLGLNIIQATANAPSYSPKLVRSLLNLILSSEICDQGTREKCISKMIANSSYFFKSNIEGEEYAKGFSEAVSSTKYLTKDEKLDILLRTLNCLKETENSLNEDKNSLDKDKNSSKLKAVKIAQATIERAIDKIKKDKA